MAGLRILKTVLKRNKTCHLHGKLKLFLYSPSLPIPQTYQPKCVGMQQKTARRDTKMGQIDRYPPKKVPPSLGACSWTTDCANPTVLDLSTPIWFACIRTSRQCDDVEAAQWAYRSTVASYGRVAQINCTNRCSLRRQTL